jgi:hypothetical protein
LFQLITMLWRFLLTMASSEESTIASYNRSAGIKVELFFTESLRFVCIVTQRPVGREWIKAKRWRTKKRKKEGVLKPKAGIRNGEGKNRGRRGVKRAGAEEGRVAQNKTPLREGRRGAVNGGTGGII